MAYGFLLLWLITLLYFVVAIFFFSKTEMLNKKRLPEAWHSLAIRSYLFYLIKFQNSFRLSYQ